MATILEMRNITKEFPGVKALDQVNFQVEAGEIHCLVGENGAGKSTLMKVLSGVFPHGDYEGDILVKDAIQTFKGIKDSEAQGIVIIYQELALIPELPIYENIFLGHEKVSNKIINWNEQIEVSERYLDLVNLHVLPATKVKDIGVGKQQLVEIAKALSKDVKILILDEPTAALNDEESLNLLRLLRELKKDGVTSIMITHKLKEVMEIADTVTVLRDGKTVDHMTRVEGTLDQARMIQSMVGREIADVFPTRKIATPGDIMLEAMNLTAYHPFLGRDLVKDSSLNVRAGEVVGIAGLMGSGRTELALSIFGNPKNYRVSGTVKIEGKEIAFDRPKKLIDAGVAYVSEDRKGNGLVLIQDVRENITLANLKALVNTMVIDQSEEILVAEKYRKDYNIKTPNIEQKVVNLSGGNQQKVSLAKWLYTQPKVLILDEPTRGIDVGAKYEIYKLINALVERGLAILLISSELPEVLGMSDRVYVMNDGTVAGELPIAEATQEKIMAMATN